MKRLQISLEPELDAALDREALTHGVSKAEVVRRAIRSQVKPLPPIEQDPIWEIVGIGEGAPGDSRSIDEIVYGPSGE